MAISDINRFNKFYKKTNQCWLWSGALFGNGYGAFRFNKKPIHAHIASFLLHRGKIPSGMCVCHTCDNHKCVNPEHLFLGTHQDNMRDMRLKGRQANHNGMKNPRAKLTTEDVSSIRALYKLGVYNQTELAKKFKISLTNICSIIHRRIWA